MLLIATEFCVCDHGMVLCQFLTCVVNLSTCFVSVTTTTTTTTTTIYYTTAFNTDNATEKAQTEKHANKYQLSLTNPRDALHHGKCPAKKGGRSV